VRIEPDFQRCKRFTWVVWTSGSGSNVPRSGTAEGALQAQARARATFFWTGKVGVSEHNPRFIGSLKSVNFEKIRSTEPLAH
jgi:hypothetical protein